MLILKNGTLMTMVDAPARGDIAIEGGRIARVGGEIPPGEGDRVIDVSGCCVTPGLIDAHSHIGLMTSGSRESDHNERSNAITPQMRALDAIWPDDDAFACARSGGITTCVACPGSINLIGGTCAAIKTTGRVVDDMLLKNPIAMKAALGENPKFRYNEEKKTPRSRMASAALMREALAKAADYGRKLALAETHPEKRPDRDLGLEALQPVLSGELMMKIHCHRTDDIATAIRICDEFGLRYTLDHVTEGYLIIDALKRALEGGCRGIIIGPLIGYNRKLESARSKRLELPLLLHEAGIPFAICTDFYELPQEFLRDCAAHAVAYGLPEDVALAAITSTPARILGIEDRVGSLKPGMDADIAVFTGNPMDIRSLCRMTIINGEIIYERRA